MGVKGDCGRTEDIQRQNACEVREEVADQRKEEVLRDSREQPFLVGNEHPSVCLGT